MSDRASGRVSSCYWSSYSQCSGDSWSRAWETCSLAYHHLCGLCRNTSTTSYKMNYDRPQNQLVPPQYRCRSSGSLAWTQSAWSASNSSPASWFCDLSQWMVTIYWRYRSSFRPGPLSWSSAWVSSSWPYLSFIHASSTILASSSTRG